MTAPKLSPAQREVLQLAAEGKVWRSYGSRQSLAWRAWGKTANVQVDALLAAGLIEAPSLSLHARPVLTDAGRALLAALTQPEGN